MDKTLRGPDPATDLQQTVRDDVRLNGPGLHCGRICEVVIHPADEGTGITFIANGVEIPGVVSSVKDTARGTSIGGAGECVMTIEHLMAGLRGCGVDNARIEVTGGEIPALDGSAYPFVEAVLAVGVEHQTAVRRKYVPREPVLVRNGDSFIIAVPSDEFSVSYVMRYDHPLIGAQAFTFTFCQENFKKEIAPARTFVLYEEVAQLISQRLAQGGSLDNTIVVWQDHLSCELRCPDELVRHKALDIIGDLAILGGTLCAEVVAVKSGHSLNVELARKLSEPGVCKGWGD